MFELDAFHFIRPYWLLTLIPMIAMLVIVLRKTTGQSHWETICDKELLPYLLDNRISSKQYGPIIAISIASILSIIALAGPTWERLPTPTFHNNASLVIALDLSRSMDATDIKPSRLSRARYKIADILNKRKDGLTALLVYAGNAYTVTPLTDDIKTIQSQLSALKTEIMPAQGSNTLAAIRHAVTLLQQADQTQGDILLITDEIDTSITDKIQALLGAFRLSILGVGTTEGAPIKLTNSNELLKDKHGNIVVPKLKQEPLRALAQSGNGIYHTISNNDRDINAFLTLLDNVSPDTSSKTKQNIKQWDDKGPWLLLLVLPFAALYFRKGLLILPFILLLPFPQPSYAFSWQDLWETPDQQGQDLFKQQKYKEAEQKFQTPEWKAVSQFKDGNYEQAQQTLSTLDTADAYYNKGNALAKSGKLKQAIDAYQKTLEIAPDHQDALYNKKLLEQALKDQQKKEHNKEEQDQSSDKQQSDNKEQQNQQQQSQNDSGQQNKDGENKQDATEGQADNKSQQNQQQAQNDSEQQSKELGNKQEQQLQNTAEQPQQSEKEQANAQWLQRIPDDPSGLLKRKFKYQYGQRKQAQQQEKSW